MRRWMVVYGENGEEAEYFNTEAEAEEKLRSIVEAAIENSEDRWPNFGNYAIYYQTHEIHDPIHQYDECELRKL